MIGAAVCLAAPWLEALEATDSAPLVMVETTLPAPLVTSVAMLPPAEVCKKAYQHWNQGGTRFGLTMTVATLPAPLVMVETTLPAPLVTSVAMLPPAEVWMKTYEHWLCHHQNGTRLGLTITVATLPAPLVMVLTMLPPLFVTTCPRIQ